jgi:hypothetical protein
MLFEKITYIEIRGKIQKIEKKSFNLLNNLKQIDFTFTFWYYLLDNLEWIRSIRNDQVESMQNTSEILEKNENLIKIIFSYNYIFDENFFLFKDFNFKNLVFLCFNTIETGKKLKCSCTFYWITRYNHYITNDEACSVLCQNYSELNCNYTKLISNCDKIKLSANLNAYDTLDRLNLANLIKFLLLFFIQIFSIIGIIVNLVNIKVIRKLIIKEKILYIQTDAI